MNHPREEVLFALLADTPPERQTVFLDATCQDDFALRQRLEARLTELQQSDTVVDPGSSADQPTVKAQIPKEEPDEAIGPTVGRYKLREKLGEGGCGVVYVAEQSEPVRRRVALKVIKLGMDTKQVVARFEAERQALAMMDHPNIAKVLDAGATSTGRPYFVMELVRGHRITDFCDQAKLTAKLRLQLFVKVCHAIQHAHQKGIIHRDIKPSNILVTRLDSEPVPKVIDFGIAKATEGRLTDNTVYTQLQQFVGTPAYMSPEQAEMTGMDIDTRSDIYSLGVLLYELLTGKTPFDAKELIASGLDGMRKTILEREPSRPSTRVSTLVMEELTTTAERRSIDRSQLVHLLKGDLDWIVMKCLEKDRTRRYETANALAADIARYLSDEPVTARPVSTLYKFQKSFRRNRLVFASAGAVLLALVAGLCLSVWQAAVATRERKAAEAARMAETEQRLAVQTALRRAEAERQRADDNANRASTNALLAQAEATKSTQVATLLKDMLAGVGPSVARGRDTTLLREILTNTVSRLDKEMADQPEVEADLRVILGRTYRDLGDYPASTAMNRRALELRRKALGERHESVAQALNELAKSEGLRGNWAEAEQFQRKALAIRRENREVTDLVIADMQNDLGILLWNGGKLGEAMAAYRAALEIKEKQLAPPNEKLADAHLNLSLLLLDRGDFAQGESEARTALAAYRLLFGDGHPKVGMALHNQAKMLVELEKNAEAERAIESAVGIYKQVYPGDHEYVAEALDDLGLILQRQGDFTRSETAFRDSLAMSKRLLGDDHPRTLSAMRHLALLKAREPIDPEAEELIQKAETLTRQRYAKQPAMLAACLSDQGAYLIRTGRPNEAVPILQEAFQVTTNGGRPAIERKRAASQLSQLYSKLGRTKDSEKWANEAVRIPAD